VWKKTVYEGRPVSTRLSPAAWLSKIKMVLPAELKTLEMRSGAFSNASSCIAPQDKFGGL